MQRFLAMLALVLCASQATAQSCPDFFRFVDFGLKASDGVTYRGGTVLRAESFGGAPLLIRDQTVCLQAQDVAIDGRGNPIPIVTGVTYDPAQTGIALLELHVAAIGDTAAAAAQNAAAHLATLGSGDVSVTRGPDFLCAMSNAASGISCQLQSPFPGPAAPVVYCDASVCTMPVMAISERLSVRAVWSNSSALMRDPNVLGRSISAKIQQIHGFLVPLSAAF